MRQSKLKTLNLRELKSEYKEKQEKYKQYYLDLKSGKEKDGSKVKFLRRDIARILTSIQKKGIEPEAEVKEVKEIKVKKIKKETIKK